jgi:hypothetical protein
MNQNIKTKIVSQVDILNRYLRILKAKNDPQLDQKILKTKKTINKLMGVSYETN